MPAPTEHHATLQKTVGVWEGTITMTIPGMEMTSAAKETVRANGPFWVVSDFESDLGGQPYQGHGCHGYDPDKKKFVGTWIDSMGSFLSIMEGEMTDEGVLVMHWDAPDMMGKIAPHRFEQVMKEGAYTSTFYTSDVKTMVIDMKHKSAKPMEAAAGR